MNIAAHPIARAFPGGLLRALSLALLCVIVPAVAKAHPDLERGKSLAADLELLPALTAFDAALATGSLTRDELVSLLDERILVLYGLRRRNELHDDLVWLSALEPDHHLDLRAPPELIAIWTTVRDQSRGPLALTLEARQAGGTLSAEARPSGTVPNGDLDTRIYVRDGLRPYKQYGASLKEPAREGARYGLYAEAVGLGGVVVARAHGPEEPLVLQASTAPAPLAPVPVQPSWARRHRGLLIGGAIVLLAAGAVTAGILVKASQDDHSNQTSLMPKVDF
jgi:hypothetical protein